MSMYGKYKNVVGPLPVKDWPVTSFEGDKGFTVQADRDDADINKIIGRFLKSGQLPPARGGEPFYGDVSDLGDLQASIMKVQEADRLFMQYSAETRERFDNDPVKFLEFLGDDDNREEALKLGLIVPRPEVPPVPPAVPAAGPAPGK